MLSTILSFPGDRADHMLLYESIKMVSIVKRACAVKRGSWKPIPIRFCDVAVTGWWSSPSGCRVLRCDVGV